MGSRSSRARSTPLAPLVLVTLGLAACGTERANLGSSTEELTSTVTIRRGTFGTVADTFISARDMRKNHGDDKKLRVSAKNEALLRFDLSSIPANAVIDRATLTLAIKGGDEEERDDCEDGDHEGHAIAPIKLHRITRAWSEHDVTYKNFDQRFDPAVAGVIRLTSRTTSKTVDVTGLVAGWVSGAQPNHGLLLRTVDRSKTLMASSEQNQHHASERPTLRVTYTIVEDHCAANPCQHGGTCTNQPDGYTCECAPGYTGTDCEQDIDDCSPNPCEHGGACTDLAAGFSCACAPGYGGDTCADNLDDCNPNPCEHGGVCTDGVDAFTCECASGYGGDRCEVNIDDCAAGPCQNGGTCADVVGGYVCTCPPGYEGSECQTNPDDCLGNACQNGATCQDGLGDYTCACAPGFTGPRCEQNIDDCAGDPCLNGGQCVDGANAYSCTCVAGYEGDNCELDIDDCAAQPCANGGQCVDGVDAFTCECQGGWIGDTCLERCPDGQQAVNGVCGACPAGSASTGGGACAACAAGTYAAQAGSAACLPCADDTISGVGAAACIACPSGSYSDAATGHTVCLDVQCGAGQAVGDHDCELCPIGEYQPAPVHGEDACLACAAGTYAPVPGTGECATCEVGHYAASTGSASCDECAPGSFTGAVGSVACEPCAAGTFAAGSAAIGCEPCAAGRYATGTGNTACALCLPGTYASTTGAASCSACPAGTIAASAGSAACVACGPGTVPNATATACVAPPQCVQTLYNNQGTVTCTSYNNLPGLRSNTLANDNYSNGGQCYNAAPLSDYIVAFGYNSIPGFDQVRFKVLPGQAVSFGAGARLRVTMGVFSSGFPTLTTRVQVSKTGFGSLTPLGSANVAYSNNQVRNAVFEGEVPFAANLATDTLYFQVMTTVQSSFILWVSSLKVEVAQACP